MKLIRPLALAFLLPTFGMHTAEARISITARNILAHDTLSWDTRLPFDDEVLTGKLENGFRYYIRKNTEPEQRVTMYLGVKVGSILETEEERGMAHFLEHMNFNGLKHFPKNELIDYLQTAGVRFGSDLNAYTGFDETVYQLPIPSDDPELLRTGLQVMRDWAQDALLDEEEIEKERGVVLEEMRGGRGADQRMREQYLPTLLNGSRYANRLPIGTEEIIMNFKPEMIRDFHRKWYRPDVQSLIVVGDIDPLQIEKEIVRLFSDMRVEPNPTPREEYTVDLIGKNQFLAITDPEMQYTVGQIYIKHPEEKIETVRDYRRSLLKTVYSQMINNRLREIAQSSNPPFVQAGVGISDFIGGLDNFSIFFLCKTGQMEQGLKSTVREIERVEQFGFTETEFKRTISSILKSNEAAYIERDKRRSDRFVSMYLDHFLHDSPAMTEESRYSITNQLLPTLALAEVEAIGSAFYVDKNRDVLLQAPEKDKDTLPTEQMVDRWLAEVKKEQLTSYVDQVSELPLLATEPIAGHIERTTEMKAIDAKELVLSNGVKVILKPTAFKNDEILIRAFSPGGTSLYPDEDYYSAANSAGLVSSSGLGQLNNVELQKYMTGKRVNISPSIGEQIESIGGSTDQEGLQTAFEIIHGYFTAPRIENDIFESLLGRALSMLENNEANPAFVFSREIQKSLYNGNIRRLPSSKEELKQIDRERALAIFKERFADASDFTFVIVGSFTEDEMKPYLERYIASLPVLKRLERARDLGILEPTKGFEKTVHKGKEQKAQVRLSFYGDYTYSETENLNIDALESVLSIKLTERLREEESGVYGTGVSASYSKIPRERYSFHVSFGTSIDKYQGMITSTMDEIRKVKENGPTQVDIDKFIIEQKRQLEVQWRDNGFWIGQIYGSYVDGEDPTYITRYLQDLEKITVESVKEIANKYLKEDRLFKFILLPDEVK